MHKICSCHSKIVTTEENTGHFVTIDSIKERNSGDCCLKLFSISFFVFNILCLKFET